ncbi:hypothetical protein BHF68_09895 [Desulfuribacillus alkaliarsenatis]|uniref:4Fe-4S ferredoxin-type domain-containing protein n=1 Tax=Desulfuribacillus alkaliarsenatis TaxID=766136 RepID=A0A1E5G039_9FIRM|nr:hypothetical protein BHF68_09895 [Desulfuribacillus alkaliarsenatis]
MQYLFLAFTVLVGIRFYIFFQYYYNYGEGLYLGRPHAVEAFLPLSALVGIKSWVSNGIFDTIHPAAIIILLTFILISYIFRKAFCGWICPFGWISERLSALANRFIGKQFTLPNWLDIPLRSIKYLLLGFFLYGIFYQMNGMAAYMFKMSDYNKISDIKMLLFLIDMSKTTLISILIILALTFYIKNFWCRYLCPYGAFMGIFGWFSPSVITRNADTCIDCSKCNKACINQLDIMNKKEVFSPECNSCLACVDACPQKGTLEYKFINKNYGKWIIPVSILTIYFGVMAIAIITGVWQTQLTPEEYLNLIPYVNSVVH